MIIIIFFLLCKLKFDVSTRPRARSPYLKRIVSAPSESAQLQPRDDSMGVQFALITAFDSKNIWLVNQSELEKMEKFCETLNAEYAKNEGSTECVPSNPGMKQGKYYVMKWETDGKYYRVVNEGDPNTARLVDYGNLAEVDYHYVFDLKEDFLNPPFSRRCTLTGELAEDPATILQEQKIVKIMFRRLKISEFGENWLVEEMKEKRMSPILVEKNGDNREFPLSNLEEYENRPCRLEFVDPIRCLIYIAFDDEDAKRNQIQEPINEIFKPIDIDIIYLLNFILYCRFTKFLRTDITFYILYRIKTIFSFNRSRTMWRFKNSRAQIYFEK